MSTLIYSPGIRVHIESSKGILDVSDDIADWRMDLRENAVHTFGFTLQNAQRKYDGLLLPQDRIAVQLKRINWLQNFTGYLNDGPIFQAWPSVLPLSASCTLKIPQFWYWDPTNSASLAMMQKALAPDGNAASTVGDHGLSNLIVESLSEVTNWDKSRIHITQVPSTWFGFAQKVGDLIQADSDMSAMIGSAPTIGGVPNSGNQVNIPAGTYVNISINPAQAAIASTIYNTAIFTAKLTAREARMALMTAWVESSFRNLANAAVADSLNYPHDGVGSNYDSIGVFQQRASWGTPAELMNVSIATQKFLAKLTQVEGPAQSANKNSDGVLIQTVQVSQYPDRYQKLENFGVALVNFAENQSVGSTGAAHNTPIGGTITGTDYKATGGQLAKVAYDLITTRSPGAITYSGADETPPFNDASDINPNPTQLDCSSLVDWVYWHTTAAHLFQSRQSRSTAQSIYNQCIQIPVALAYQIQGAALFINESGGIGHVGIALGYEDKGDWQHVAAHMHYPTHPQDDVNISAVGSQFNRAGLLPGIDYSKSAVNQAAATQLQAILKTPTSIAPTLASFPASSSADGTATTNPAFEALLNTLIFNPTSLSAQSDALLPSRQYMVNQPFLPWLSNVVNASMRSFCSAPNGDFMAWFPDYFGLWGTAASMDIELIELQNFDIDWSDQYLVTHQYVIGSPGSTALNQDDGSVSTIGSYSQLSLFASTQGIATMDFPEIFEAIYGQAANPAWCQAFLKRFGVRPDVKNIPQIFSAGSDAVVSQGQATFFMALYLFMQAWANMFTATVPLTFMPELWPGMLLRIPQFGFQAYVRGVTHSGSFGSSGSFTTDVDICAPSNIGGSARTDLIGLLPNGGDPLVSTAKANK